MDFVNFENKFIFLLLILENSQNPLYFLYAIIVYLQARRMVITAAVGSTIRSGPAQIALTLVIRRFAAISVDASLIASLGTILFAIAIKTAFALTTKAAVSIGAKRIGMAIVQAEITFIHIRALRVCPARLISVQTAVSILVDDRTAIDMSLIEVALHAHASDRILQTIAPAAAE